MTLQFMQAIVDSALYDAHIAAIVPVSINNRLTRSLGRAKCKVNRNTRKVYDLHIEISGVHANNATTAELTQTLLHECAHIIAYMRYPTTDHGHDHVFRAICAEIGCKDNKATVTTTYKSADVLKYTLECPVCHHQWGFARMQRKITNRANCQCPYCFRIGLDLVKGGE